MFDLHLRFLSLFDGINIRYFNNFLAMKVESRLILPTERLTLVHTDFAWSAIDKFSSNYTPKKLICIAVVVRGRVCLTSS